jgi:ABC-type molybdate transport system ATPase subunit
MTISRKPYCTLWRVWCKYPAWPGLRGGGCILTRDVSLAVYSPLGHSILNVLPAHVVFIARHSDPLALV